MPHVPLVEVSRAGRVECVHYGSVAVCDVTGRLLFAAGDPDSRTYLRSSAKPFQAVAVVQSGAAERWGFTDEELALCCASHGAQPFHLRAVESMLGKCGLTPSALKCGPHAPLHAPSAEALATNRQKPQPIHNNCSGKHAGMLAVCRHMHWPIETYLQPDHPLQWTNLTNMALFAGVAATEIPLGVDGCGVPTFYLPLSRVAAAFARLANAGEPAELKEATRRVAGSMVAFPVHVAYEGNFGAVLLESVGEPKGASPRLLAKGGAEGVFGVGLIGRGIGIACKISDGASRAIPPVIVRLLEQFLDGADLTALKRLVLKPITNTRGEEVGELRSSI
jgi:L-asparaginase II